MMKTSSAKTFRKTSLHLSDIIDCVPAHPTDVCDLVAVKHIEHGFQLRLRACQLNDQGVLLHVNDIGPENVRDRQNITSVPRVRRDLHENQLPVDRIIRHKDLDVPDIFLLHELGRDLFEYMLIPTAHDGHSGNKRIGRHADCQAVNIVRSSRKKAGNSGKYAGRIIYQQ